MNKIGMFFAWGLLSFIVSPYLQKVDEISNNNYEIEIIVIVILFFLMMGYEPKKDKK